MTLKKSKQITTLLLSAIFVVGMAACGQADEPLTLSDGPVIQGATAEVSGQTANPTDTPNLLILEQVVEDQEPIELREATTVLAAAHNIIPRGVVNLHP